MVNCGKCGREIGEISRSNTNAVMECTNPNCRVILCDGCGSDGYTCPICNASPATVKRIN